MICLVLERMFLRPPNLARAHGGDVLSHTSKFVQ
jgi:hypothetical protein